MTTPREARLEAALRRLLDDAGHVAKLLRNQAHEGDGDNIEGTCSQGCPVCVSALLDCALAEPTQALVREEPAVCEGQAAHAARTLHDRFVADGQYSELQRKGKP